ncbi:MAG TPA: HPF/RaiA family ribosome-associated protein [Candidatus Kryptonia bacterium]
MRILINTDHNIIGHEAFIADVSGRVESALSRFSDHIIRVDVHLSDQTSHRNSPSDKRCMMEARLEGRQPIVVTHEAPTLDQAIGGASDKLAKLIENTLGRLRDKKSSRTHPPRPRLSKN